MKLPLFSWRKLLIIFATVLISLLVLWEKEIVVLPPKIARSLRLLEANLSRTPLVPKPKPTVLLDVAFHRQKRSLSCEAASLKMALAGVGIDLPESEIVAKLLFDPTPRIGNIWGDPDKGFVGNIDGRMMKDGYGVYAKPIAQTAGNWVQAEVLNNATVQDLTSHLLEKRPIVIWGYVGKGEKVEWQTPEGKIVRAVNGEHARVVVGFAGSSADPQGFFIIDPIYGQLYWKTSKFLHQWESLGRMAVVISPITVASSN